MVAIKDMEMPRSCFCCPFSKRGSVLDGGYYCKLQPIGGMEIYPKSQYRIDGEFKDKQGCPLVETEERKQGEWDRGYSFPDGQYVKCSCCNELIKCTYPMHYCPNCGADMREE